ncbi:hypothetical protein SpCBS45565_g07364 [Spizellomyces sp. 'palustris']|nr:hypothetical protein SpCBS45565_g07364 [Spizellomyces sp. 'palustris']
MQNPDSGSAHSIQLEAFLDSKALIKGRPRDAQSQSKQCHRPPSDVTNEYLASVSAARYANLEQELYRSENHAAELQRELDELESYNEELELYQLLD